MTRGPSTIVQRIAVTAVLAALIPWLPTAARASAPASRDAAWWLAHGDVPALQELLGSGELSAEALTRAALDRIETLDGELHAVIAVDPTALDQARELDRELAESGPRGSLHGIPVLLKDNIETSAQPTTAGSLALADNDTGRDAPLVARLREAGAVIVGKANLSEWANFRSTRSSSGWSAVGGQTRNPHDPARSPCGSSSGSAAAVAAGYVPLAIGTETNGSVVCPSSANGVVGIKPTVGLVSRTHVVPISHSQDTAGPMGRTVTDAVTLLEAMAGPDPGDPASERAAGHFDRDLSAHLDADGLDGKRIGVVRSSAGFHSEVDALLEWALEDMEAAGATIVDDLEFEEPEDFSQATFNVLLYEFKHDLNAYLAGLPSEELSRLTLERLIEFNREHADEEMPWFGQEIFERSQETDGLDSETYTEALELARKATREDGIDRLVAEHELDALIAPTGAPAWAIDLVNGDHFIGGSSTLAAVSGYPNVTVPMGTVHGLPVGLSIFGPAFSEPTLIEIASGYEQTGQR
ncbi:MAG: amidase [Thermoanaerobaculia bacterium]